VLPVRSIVSRGRIGVAMTAAIAAIACASAASAEAAITARDGDGKKLAAFAGVSCNGSSKSKVFSGTATDSGWKLSIKIQPFAGFGFYHVGYGKMGKVEFFLRSGATTYSNTVFPPNTSTDEVGEGGNVGFPGGGGKIGFSFGTAFQVGEPLGQASLGGLATCS
jgi:hypothetical protein